MLWNAAKFGGGEPGFSIEEFRIQQEDEVRAIIYPTWLQVDVPSVCLIYLGLLEFLEAEIGVVGVATPRFEETENMLFGVATPAIGSGILVVCCLRVPTI